MPPHQRPLQSVFMTQMTLKRASGEPSSLYLILAVPQGKVPGEEVDASHLRSPKSPGISSALTLSALKPWRRQKIYKQLNS